MKKLLSALVAATAIVVAMSGLVLATHAIAGDVVAPNSNTHTYVAGNPKCGEPEEGGLALKIDAGNLHVGNYGPIDITYYDGKYVSWAINAAYIDTYDAGTVIVKGGPNAIVYGYVVHEDPTNSAAAAGLPGGPPAGSPADLFDDQDYRLTSPQNFNGAGPKYYGISPVDFCFDAKA